MARNYERDEREAWRRQQNREDEYGWGGHRHEDRNWREDQEMVEGYRGQGMQRRWDRGNEGNPAWQGGRGGWQGDRWQGGDYQSGRGYENRRWENDREMEPRYGRNDWNRAMGGGWYPNAERWTQGNWNQGNWNQGMHG